MAGCLGRFHLLALLGGEERTLRLCVYVTEGHRNEAWPQGAAQTGMQDGVSQEEGFHVSAS